LAAVCLLAGCANYRPIVDSLSIPDVARYERDLSDCQRYAEEINPGVSAAVGAVLGGLLGAALGAVADDPYWGITAAGGAIGGLAGSTASAVGDQKEVVRECMRQRGYAVLN
jgi:uncharacterized protein YcfJ